MKELDPSMLMECNMKTKAIERNELIATRVPPGDRWTLVDDSKKLFIKA
jgi:hypothetical protein